MQRFALSAIRFYQRYLSLDSGWALRLRLGQAPVCRFVPTCSEYTYQAVEGYGIIYGLWLGLQRIVRCHPWNKGGFDPVK
ncbi:membrane protein insertion efficiency factor YidD [Candidatus Gottesmanbacteria bacterium RIFCSPLOWO2_01_FULL_46_9]|uniref:Putative membrane protein insertion efficiency factor n=1 Tax=Candidatus Gottesmanbacteria bacterium RIFCSPLOWO2_01_FULL_46_9 TaxID=1798394 RepID=A0A1F6AZ33_9BACT|nr:MAG: membrane protein insertion efficiency factor YidD [Candidatus Gottesmanbacteria bacterium RIFCSPLOWO2_01_FULL_46_9]